MGTLGPFPDCLTQGYLGPFHWNLAKALGHLRYSLLASNLTGWCGVETKCSPTSMLYESLPAFLQKATAQSFFPLLFHAALLICTSGLVRTHVMGSLGFRWSLLSFLVVLARGANCTNVHLARLIPGVKKASLDVHDISLASGSADVLGFGVCQLVLHWNGQTNGTYSSSRADGLFAPSHERSGDGARQWFRVFLGAQRSWCSLNL